MIEPKVRRIKAGSTDIYVWVRIVEETGADVSTLTPDLRTVSPAGVVSAWAPAVLTEHPSLDVIRCALQHDAVEVGYWQVDARLTDSPEVEIVDVGGFSVVL